MFNPDKKLLRELAELAVKMGANVQIGQPLVINGPVEAYELIRECIDVAYSVGSSQVIVNYSDERHTRLNYENMSVEKLSEVPNYAIEKKKYEIDNKVAYLHILAEDPDLLSGIDSEKISKPMMARMKAMAPYRYYTMNNIGQWTIIAYPEVNWARKVFPGLSDDEAMNKLFEAILKTSRVEIGKSIDNWKAHNAEIAKRSEKMNEYNFKELRYKNSKGTDLTIGLVKNHIWEGGAGPSTERGCLFNANIPSEEIFTMPDCRNINGTIVSTMPLAHNGNVISEFRVTFKDGKVVEYSASDNLDVLKQILDTDDGAKSLGEVALISYDSPINDTGILFYNTLFDENASCHFAFGDSYPTTVKGGSDMTKEERAAIGSNSSMTHVDFMVGSRDLSIIGVTYDGKEIAVFENGNFVI